MGSLGNTAAAQETGEPFGSLTIWVVRPATAADRAVQRAGNDLRSVSAYRETTAGSFGRPASEVGQTAGSYGKPASEVGRPASEVGQTAGSFGQTAGSLPGNVPSQTAGSYGQTAGSFGVTASDFHGAPVPANELDTSEFLLRMPEWQAFTAPARTAFPSLRFTFLEVRGLELRERLQHALGTQGYPDVLLMPPLPYTDLLFGEVPSEEGQDQLDRLALIHVGKPFLADVMRTLQSRHLAHREWAPYPTALGTVRAPHGRATRAFLEWFDDDRSLGPRTGSVDGFLGDLDPASPEGLALKTAARTAAGATDSLLSGGNADGLADEQMARFTLSSAVSILYVPRARVPADLHSESTVLRVSANGRFAVVLLHAEVVSARAWGHFTPLVILRKVASGPWKVLHVSLDLPEATAEDAYKLLTTCTGPGNPAVVRTVALASPREGDVRAGSGLDLLWDDESNARLLVVEYQSLLHEGPDRPHLFLMSDREPKLQTRVAVPLGETAGPLRWRVWSLGEGGSLEITPWRNLTLLR